MSYMPLAVLTRSVTGQYGGSISLDLGLSTVSFSPPPPLDSFVAVATVTAVPRDPSTVLELRRI